MIGLRILELTSTVEFVLSLATPTVLPSRTKQFNCLAFLLGISRLVVQLHLRCCLQERPGCVPFPGDFPMRRSVTPVVLPTGATGLRPLLPSTGNQGISQ